MAQAAVDRNVIRAGAGHVAVQRIARGHWSATLPMRSWGVAPLWREGETLLVPCWDGEVLWLAVWNDTSDRPATLDLQDAGSAGAGHVVVPPGDRIVGLADAGGAVHAIGLPAGTDGRRLHLRIAQDGDDTALVLQLVPPAAWAAASGQPAPLPRAGPPPLPPRLG